MMKGKRVKVLVTGDRGYIGTVLCAKLLREGYLVSGFDAGFFDECLITSARLNYESVNKDIRDIEQSDLQGIDVIVHLAGLSNDPLGELDSALTNEINFEATARMASIAKKVGVTRFIFVSSQSIYGVADTTCEVDELGAASPVTAYAKSKLAAEHALMEMSNSEFCVIALRPSTVYGPSPRFRSDIVFNSLMGSGYVYKEVTILSDGTPWRPVVSIYDVCSAITCAIELDAHLIAGEAYNVGVIDGNFQVRDLARVASLITSAPLRFEGIHTDSRSYKVSFEKIITTFGKLYSASTDLKSGGEQILSFFEKVGFGREDFEGSKTNRLKHLLAMIDKGKLSGALR